MLNKYYLLFIGFILIVLLSNLSVSAQYSSDEYTLALWHFDKINNSLSTIVDSGPNNYYTSGFTLVKQGVYNESAFLNNEHPDCGGSYISIYPSFPKINDSQPFTIELYILMFDLWNQPIISEIQDPNSGPEPLLSLNGNKIIVYIAKSFYSNQELEINKWYHLALTYQNPYLTLWINGKQDIKENVGEMGNVFTGVGTLAIGRSKFSGTSCPYFNGLIDEVRISNISRTDFEVNSLVFSTNLTKQQILEGLEEERQVRIEEERKIAEEKIKAEKLQTEGEREKLEKLEQQKILEEEKKKVESAKRVFNVIIILVIIILTIFYLRNRYKRKRRIKEEKEKLRHQQIEERKRKLEEERKRKQWKEEERKRKEFELKQRTAGFEIFDGKWVKKEEIPKLKELKVGLDNNFKNMSPFQFEEFIAKLFRAMGYQTEVTKKTGDYGIDVIAKKGNDILAIQCKKYHEDNPVGNRDVQRLLGAMRLKGIKANHSVLITTSHFTVQAKEQAEDNAIELWDKHLLHEMVRKYLMKI